MNAKSVRTGSASWGRLVTCTAALAACAACGPTQKWSETRAGAVHIVTQQGGPTLGYATTSGVKLLTVDSFAFKDLDKNGKLDPYEDWRVAAKERASDLASKLSIEQIAGLMLYSRHQAVPNAAPQAFFPSTYRGRPYAESGARPSDISDDQQRFLRDDNLRHVLITRVESPAVAAEWNNNIQAFVEGLALGIPANTSSDPRNESVADADYNAGAGGNISMWPTALGLAATFDPKLVEKFARTVAQEYRALGIATALSPQVDLATEPRWFRFTGTYGEDPALATDMARAYIDGIQTSTGSDEIADGWGYKSVNAMVKHWPGAGAGEGGRDGHYAYGKFAVYPGGNFALSQKPFVDGAFKLSGKTRRASAVMPTYTIAFNQTPDGENVAAAYSKYLIEDLLRKQNGFDGVVCTDWEITGDIGADISKFQGGRSWGVEKGVSVAERHYRIIMAGVDQFGGNNEAGPIVEAYNIGVKEHGEATMRKRLEESAVRLLLNMFRVGLFENPYLDVAATTATVGKAEFMQAGFEAQLKSVVLLKNRDNLLPLQKGIKVYIPERFLPARRGQRGNLIPESRAIPVRLDLARKYFTVTDKPADADVALVVVESPNGGMGYLSGTGESEGYVPIPLQYAPYKATEARANSLAGGHPTEKSLERSFRGKTVTATNTTDLKMIEDAVTAMKSKPVIVIVRMNNPTVVKEFEPRVSALLAHFGVQDQALFEILTGATEPSALLPMQLPRDMQTVERQFEDTPHDMQPYVDAVGNHYEFGFGLNWKGVINDQRTARYAAPSRVMSRAD